MPRLTREDWLREGLYLLAEQGIAALTIDSLTRVLQVTKGSFYHHFRDFAAYKTALLTYFAEVSTHDVMAMLEQEPSPLHKLRRLCTIAAFAPSNPERAVRIWAAHDAEARAVQTRIDQQRITYVQGLCTTLGIDRAQAQRMGQLAYVILVGSQQMQPALPAEDIQVLFDEFFRLYQLG